MRSVRVQTTDLAEVKTLAELAVQENQMCFTALSPERRPIWFGEIFAQAATALRRSRRWAQRRAVK